MLQTGDRITFIEGVFSGTLSYLFNTMAPDLPFSAAVQQAKDRCVCVCVCVRVRVRARVERGFLQANYRTC